MNWMRDKDYTGWSAELPRPALGGYVGPGWLSIVIDLHKKLSAIDPEYRLVQVKEKFGALRYYFDPSSRDATKLAQLQALVDDAERKSAETCEECGKPGEILPGTRGWVKCLCEVHHAERQKQDDTAEIRAMLLGTEGALDSVQIDELAKKIVEYFSKRRNL